VNFGCAKLFVSVDRSNRVLQSGLQVERGYSEAPAAYRGALLREDWDWHRLLGQCRKGSDLDAELGRLVRREGFVAQIGDWGADLVLDKRTFRSAEQLRNACARVPGDRWAGFQLYYPMPEKEVRACTGYELVLATRSVFDEVIPSMNLCMQVKLTPVVPLPRRR
jgi:hypothetical protein